MGCFSALWKTWRPEASKYTTKSELRSFFFHNWANPLVLPERSRLGLVVGKAKGLQQTSCVFVNGAHHLKKKKKKEKRSLILSKMAAWVSSTNAEENGCKNSVCRKTTGPGCNFNFNLVQKDEIQAVRRLRTPVTSYLPKKLQQNGPTRSSSSSTDPVLKTTATPHLQPPWNK